MSAINSAVFSSALAPVYYVDGSAGLDTNLGTTADQPLKTLIEAEFRTAAVVFDANIQIIVLTAGTYVLPSFRPRIYRGGQLYVRAVPQTTVLPATAALAGSTSSLIKSTGLTVDQFLDKWIHVLTGAAANDYRMVKSNSATDIVPVRDFSAAIAQGDTYEIVDALVILNGSARPLLSGAPVYRQGTRFIPSLNFENFVVTGGTISCAGRVAWWRSRTSAALLSAVDAAQMLVGIDGLVTDGSAVALSAFGPQRIYGGLITAYLGAGFVLNFLEEPDAGGCFGYLNSTDGLFIRNHPFTQLFGGRSRDDHVTVEGGSTVAVFGGDITAQFQIDDGEATGALRIWKGSYCTFSRGVVNGAGTIGVAVESGGHFDVTGLGSAISIAGGTYGIMSRRGAGQVYLNEAAPNITGATARYAAGETPSTSNSLPNVGDTLAASPDDGSRITRIA